MTNNPSLTETLQSHYPNTVETGENKWTIKGENPQDKSLGEVQGVLIDGIFHTEVTIDDGHEFPLEYLFPVLPQDLGNRVAEIIAYHAKA